MKIASRAPVAAVVFTAMAIAALTGCGNRPYKTTETLFAGRPVPPSKLTQRVMVGTTLANLATGTLQILDAKRDIRYNVFDTNSIFTIQGFGGNVQKIINYPEQLRGYVYNQDGSLISINYGTETTAGAISALSGTSTSVAVPVDVQGVYATQEQNGLFLLLQPNAANATASAVTASYQFSVPNVFKVAVNPSHSVVLLFARNSNLVYRLLKLNSDQVAPLRAVSCQPISKPEYCVVPVGTTQPDGSVRDAAFHRPIDAYFSPDGSQAYIISCGRECGGAAATGDDVPAINFVNISSLRVDNYPTTGIYATPVVSSTPVPGGVTSVLSDGATIYAAGQQLQASGRFAGNLSLVPLNTLAVSATFSIADGEHTRMIFADDNTLWIGASNCANGQRAFTNQNYNCLTRFSITTKTAAVVPAATPGTSTTVPYPNQNLDNYYYGSATGICWVEGLNKVYTAYGGQVHVFRTADGVEMDNRNLTVQGTVTDVVYMDASTNVAN